METYEYQTMRSVEDTYWWYAGLRYRVIDCLKTIIRPGEQLRILDAGCGTGGMMRLLKIYFSTCEIIGIDFSPQATQFSRDRNAGPVIMASVDKAPFCPGSFDIIVSLDAVLEMRGINNAQALLDFHRMLKDGGRLILNITAFECLRGEHDDAVHVEKRFTKRELLPILEQAGFTAELSYYWNTLLFPALLAYRTLSRFRTAADRPVSDLTPLPGWLNRMMTWLSLKETHITRRISPPFGSSLFVLARRNSG